MNEHRRVLPTSLRPTRPVRKPCRAGLQSGRPTSRGRLGLYALQERDRGLPGRKALRWRWWQNACCLPVNLNGSANGSATLSQGL